MVQFKDIAMQIKNHNNIEEIIKTISSDFEYYNSILELGEITIDYKKIITRTTFLGLAALYGNTNVLIGFLQAGVPADGLDLFLYRSSLNERSNYRLPSQNVPNNMFPAPYLKQDIKCWSTMTEVLDHCDERVISIPWSTPVLLAILAENAEGLKLLLEHGATCDLRYPYYAKALSLCEDKAVMDVLLRYSESQMRETTADPLIIFNLPLAKYLFNLGIRPDKNIIRKIINRNKVATNSFFETQYEITASSKGWEDFYRKRADACIDFYQSKGYTDEEKTQLWDILEDDQW